MRYVSPICNGTYRIPRCEFYTIRASPVLAWPPRVGRGPLAAGWRCWGVSSASRGTSARSDSCSALRMLRPSNKGHVVTYPSGVGSRLVTRSTARSLVGSSDHRPSLGLSNEPCPHGSLLSMMSGVGQESRSAVRRPSKLHCGRSWSLAIRREALTRRSCPTRTGHDAATYGYIRWRPCESMVASRWARHRARRIRAATVREHGRKSSGPTRLVPAHQGGDCVEAWSQIVGADTIGPGASGWRMCESMSVSRGRCTLAPVSQGAVVREHRRIWERCGAAPDEHWACAAVPPLSEDYVTMRRHDLRTTRVCCTGGPATN